MQLEIVLGIPRFGVKGGLVDCLVAEHHGLRQRWSIVRQVRFGAEQGDGAGVAEGAKFFGCADPSQASADDDDVFNAIS